ncbi:MAG: xanthine dehydrogenase small subunit [Myxococcota bacterium]|jgi:xanthine dehydrogenase small subunit
MQFQLNGHPAPLDGIDPTTTLLEWLRAHGHTGTKEGCAEGDCGACAVAVRDATASGSAWRAVCACILPVAQVADREVVTVEGLAERDRLHPAQQALVDRLGSQCGYCTPGFVMSLFEATYRDDLDAGWKRDDQLCGNLCRCTGYRPIRDALTDVAGTRPDDRFSAVTAEPPPAPSAVAFETEQGAFARPTRWEDLWEVLTPEARVVHGATDLGLEITKQRATYDRLVAIDALPGLDDLSEDAAGWTVGGGVRLSTLEAWSEGRLPVVLRMLRFFASRLIKNRATVGGNLCNASPIGDLPPALLALDAAVVLRSVDGDRTVPLSGFFLAYRKTALRPGELLAAVRIPRQPKNSRMAAYKVSKRRELDISAVCAGFVVATDARGVVTHARLAYGGMAATPARASTAEDNLLGQVWSEEVVEHAAAALTEDFKPIDDHRSSAWYRATVAANLLRGFYTETLTSHEPGLPDRPSGTVLPGGAP